VRADELEKEIALLKKRKDLILAKGTKEIEISGAEEYAKAMEKEADANQKRAEALSDSIAQGLLDGFRRGQSFADIFINELKAQFAKTVLSPIIQPIVMAGNDMMSGLLNMIGGALGLPTVKGNGWEMGPPAPDPASYGGRYAGGGPVGAGTLSRVNELRTEGLTVNGEKFLLMGPQGGVIDSNPRLGGNVVVNQSISVGAGVSRSEVAAAMHVAKEQAKMEIFQSMRRNGAFARA
jgi:hypothetical protein